MSHFIICSPGKTGSFWLANALDIHPDIICTHSKHYVPASEVYISGWKGHEQIGVAWKDREVSEELARALTEKYGKAIEQEHERFRMVFHPYKYGRTVDEFLSLQEGIGEAKYYGNAHAFTWNSLLVRCAFCKPTRRFKVANMLRHPVKVLESAMSRTFIFEDLEVLASIDRTGIDTILKRYNLEFSPRVVNFIKSCNDLGDLLLPLQYPNLLHIPLERISGDREYFSLVLRTLTSDDIEISNEYLDRVFSMGKLNRHSKDGRRNDSPEALFSKWEDWQKDYFSAILRYFQHLIPKAEELGYKLSNFLVSETKVIQVSGFGNKGQPGRKEMK